MNSAKVQNILLPIIIVVTFIAVSYSLSSMITSRTWGNILTLGSLELVCFYVISRAGFNKNRKRFMCCILAIQFSLFTTMYSLVTWFYTNFNIGVIDYIHNAMYSTYETASAVISVLLLLIAVWPERLLDGFAAMVRIDSYLSSINERTGLYIFSVDRIVRR